MSTDYFDWERLWALLLGVALFALIALGVASVIAPKNVDYYYASHGSGAQSNTCVWAHWTWHTDEQAFCTDDYQRALDFLAKANGTIKK